MSLHYQRVASQSLGHLKWKAEQRLRVITFSLELKTGQDWSVEPVRAESDPCPWSHTHPQAPSSCLEWGGGGRSGSKDRDRPCAVLRIYLSRLLFRVAGINACVQLWEGQGSLAWLWGPSVLHVILKQPLPHLGCRSSVTVEIG